jgi:ATP-dependent DNA helicase RecG
MNKNNENLLQTPINLLKGVGPSLESKLANLNIRTIQDCLLHLPTRYQDRTHITPIRSLQAGQYAVIEANVVNAQVTQGKRKTLRVQLHDGTGIVYLRYFFYNPSLEQKFAPGTRVRVFGEIRLFNHLLEIAHPDIAFGKPGNMPPLQENLTPLYPLTEGLTQQGLRKVISLALDWLSSQSLPEFLPQDLLKQYAFPPLGEALHFCHNPPREVEVNLLLAGKHPAQQRLIFEELCAHHLSLIKLRNEEQKFQSRVCADNTLSDQLICALPFDLTQAQQRVLQAIQSDVMQPRPMMRLLQGDVGSGKTVVAAAAMAQAVASGYQAALMAPTEILAEQHYQNFKQWFEPLNIPVAWLTGKLTAKTKRETLDSIVNGHARIIIGTHALVQEAVEYQQLGFVVIDEQHRFGVHQRLALAEKGLHADHLPHQLIMTATPIPRTLAMTAYADLDYSVIDELPPGRTPITTIALSQDKRPDIMQRIFDACQQGKQVYWVCTLIEDSEHLNAEAATLVCEQLREAMPSLNIGLVHGRLKSSEKEEVMRAFSSNQIQLLVATTVIEVGVNVPNASLMIIENPERLGLSQLHQLRGRVGRGSEKSHCVLLYQSPLSYTARQRIQIMRETTDGFLIAEKDLELRGPGEWLGTRQTGTVSYRIADLIRDKDWVPKIKPAAENILAQHPDHAQAMISRWLGLNLQYAGV